MLKKLYNQYKVCLVRITVKLDNGDFSNGTAFHIGNGYLVTAKHVIENNKISQIYSHETFQDLVLEEIYYSDESKIDLAIIKTNFSLEHYMHNVTIIGADYEKVDSIALGGHLDDWIGDEFILSQALLMGYPPIPFSNEVGLVAAKGEINAIIDKYDAEHPYFIVSTMARGGFSGGPLISEYGFLLGVIVESLVMNDLNSELGYLSAISIEPLLLLIKKNNIKLGGENEELINMLL